VKWIALRQDCNSCLAVIPRYLIFIVGLKGFVSSLYGGAVLRSDDATPSSYMNLIAFFFFVCFLQAVLLLPTHLNSVP
jgi:prepilin signal peptidase PulO-like enzyme (type II secretory pathway)